MHSRSDSDLHPASRNGGYAPTLHDGWYFAAMVDDLTSSITGLRIGDRRVMVVKLRDEGIGVYDAVCPHRGADLTVGGVLTRAGVLCPFHGKAVALGTRESSRYAVGELPAFVAGGALFVALSDIVQDNGFRDHLTGLAATHRFFPCPATDIGVPHELVVENAFDLDHFIQVHRIPKVVGSGFGLTEHGAAWTGATFQVRTPDWDGSGPKVVIQNRFLARAFSPSVVVSELGPAATGQSVITTATPAPTGCRVRVLNAVRPGPDGTVPERFVAALTDGAIKALRQDAPVWDNLDLDMTPTFDPRDEPVVLFRRFCEGFSDLARRPVAAGVC